MAQPRPAFAGPFAMAFFVPNAWLRAHDRHSSESDERGLNSSVLCGFVIGVHALRMRYNEERELRWRWLCVRLLTEFTEIGVYYGSGLGPKDLRFWRTRETDWANKQVQ